MADQPTEHEGQHEGQWEDQWEDQCEDQCEETREETYEEKRQRALDEDFPLLLAKRYSPEAKDEQESACDESIASAPASSPRSHFSFTRLARGVVDSLMPEPLRPQRVLRKRPPPLDLSPSRKFNASTVALYEQ